MIVRVIFRQIRIYALISVLGIFMSCYAQKKPDNNGLKEQPNSLGGGANLPIFGANLKAEMGEYIISIFEDKKGHYWFGTNGEGVYRYIPSAMLRAGERTMTRFTDKDGLCNNQVRSIQEDKSGNIWFGTAGGISRYDGRAFTTFPGKESKVLGMNYGGEWKIEPDDLWFEEGNGSIYRYDGHSFTYLQLPNSDFDSTNLAKSGSKRPYSDALNAYSVYCILKDKKGNIWFGTQTMGVCRYSGGNSFTWFTEKGLSGPAVRGLFEDTSGNLWFGNNGYGLFRYSPLLRESKASFSNITEEQGLGNEAFFKTLKVSSKLWPGTMARVWTINEDNNGDIWIGTIDAGVWRYPSTSLRARPSTSLRDQDGKLINYTTKDGLTSNAINVIYKDKKGELWFGTDGAGVCQFNGTGFKKAEFK